MNSIIDGLIDWNHPLIVDEGVQIGARYPLAQAAEAHRALEARETTGSTILSLR